MDDNADASPLKKFWDDAADVKWAYQPWEDGYGVTEFTKQQFQILLKMDHLDHLDHLVSPVYPVYPR